MAPWTLFQLTTGPAVVNKCRTWVVSFEIRRKLNRNFADHRIWGSFCDVSHKDSHCRTSWNCLRYREYKNPSHPSKPHPFWPLLKVGLWGWCLILGARRHPTRWHSSRRPPGHHVWHWPPLTKTHWRHGGPRGPRAIPGHLKTFRLKILKHSLVNFYHISQLSGNTVLWLVINIFWVQ